MRSWKDVSLAGLTETVREIEELLDFPCLIFLEGEMGSGKTTFVQHFCRLRGQGEALSPTYSLLNQYGTVLHGDFYRLKEPAELEHLGLPFYLESCDVFLVEWGWPFREALKGVLEGNFPRGHRLELGGSGTFRDYFLTQCQNAVERKDDVK